MSGAQAHTAEQAPPASVVRGCLGKKAYPSWRAAHVALRHTIEHRRRECYARRDASLRGYRLEPYRCPHCHEWHIGNQVRAKRRKGRGR
jgi:hypothetical protein